MTEHLSGFFEHWFVAEQMLDKPLPVAQARD